MLANLIFFQTQEYEVDDMLIIINKKSKARCAPLASKSLRVCYRGLSTQPNPFKLFPFFFMH